MTDHVPLTDWPTGRVGLVTIVGRPNVGKSTFLNHALRYHLAAVSARPQTTRRHWRGVLSDDESQIIFIDTPGVHDGKTKLGDAMLASVSRSLDDADVIVCIVDPSRECGAEDELVADRIGGRSTPVVLALNKSDITTLEQRDAATTFYCQHLKGEVTPSSISALSGEGTDELIQRIRNLLPYGPFFYPLDHLTDAVERDIGAEMIREAALEKLFDEVPHALAVCVDTWKDTGKRLRIGATIFVERESQKGIVVGRSGAMIQAIRRDAVQRLRELVDGHVDLRLYVKVAEGWRNRSSFLREHGLAEQ